MCFSLILSIVKLSYLHRGVAVKISLVLHVDVVVVLDVKVGSTTQIFQMYS